MTKEKQIEILIKDGHAPKEAQKHLKNGAVIFEDLEENFLMYSKEWDLTETEKADFLKMFQNKKPLQDWGIVTENGKNYYIQYFL